MALFGQFGGLVKAGLGVLAGRGGLLGTAGQFGSTVLSSFLPAQGPVARQPDFGGGFEATPVMAGGVKMLGMAGALASVVTPILARVAGFLGRRTLSLREVIKIFRRMGRVLGPTAIAAALGITVAEMGMLILADSQRPRRRMNAGNVKALRRSMRRIESFHRLCVRADSLRSRRRSSPRRAQAHPAATQIVRAG